MAASSIRQNQSPLWEIRLSPSGRDIEQEHQYIPAFYNVSIESISLKDKSNHACVKYTSHAEMDIADTSKIVSSDFSICHFVAQEKS